MENVQLKKKLLIWHGVSRTQENARDGEKADALSRTSNRDNVIYIEKQFRKWRGWNAKTLIFCGFLNIKQLRWGLVLCGFVVINKLDSNLTYFVPNISEALQDISKYIKHYEGLSYDRELLKQQHQRIRRETHLNNQDLHLDFNAFQR